MPNLKRVHKYFYMKKILSIVLTFSVLSGFAQSPELIETVTKKGNEIVIPYQKYKLKNGLTVILTEDHSDPIAHVDVTYHVGSAREQIGKSGFAHFFEHMMFEGSDHVASGAHFKTVNGSGGTLNGTTNQDRTNYFETVPSNQLEKMLWLESDRMGFLLDAVTQKKFEIQRATVKNERGQNYDNRPYGLAFEAVSKALYPYGHPYSWLTIGYIEDLDNGNVNDLKKFFMRWYGPNNATLTIGGDIDIKQTLAWVEKYFGSIPPGPVVKPTQLPAPVLTNKRYASYIDNYAKQPLLFVAYPGVKMYDADIPAIDALTMILGQGANSLLYKNLVKSRKAVQANVFANSSELAGFIGMQILPYPGQTLAEMETLLQESFAEFERTGVSDDDLLRFKGNAESSFVNAISSISGKVSQLAESQTFKGDPNQIGRELAAIRRVSKEDIIRVFNQYIKGKPSVVLSILPKGSDVKPAATDNFTVARSNYTPPEYGYENLTYKKAVDKFDRNIEPPVGPNPSIKVPAFWQHDTGNGIKMIGAFNGEIPEVNILMSLKGGGLLAENAPDKAGLPTIVAQMLNEDTQTLTAEEVSSKLSVLGSRISITAGTEEINFNISSLTKNIDQTLILAEERLFRPKFTQESLDRIKKQTIQGMISSKAQPAYIASTVFNKVLYGVDNIRTYGLRGNEETINAITLADVQSFYDKYFSPDLTSVVLTGELNESAAKQKLAFLNSWTSKPATVSAPAPPQSNISPKTIYYVNIPNAAQSEIRLGYYTGVNYDATGLSYRMELANFSLGGGFDSRLNLDLREEKGWTYGAGSNFTAGKYGGQFAASAGVRASVTDSAALEFIKIMSRYRDNGITSSELTFLRSAIGQSDALAYETNEQKASFLYRIQKYSLQAGFIDKQNKILKTINKEEVDQLVKKYLDPEKMVMLIVGDKVHFLDSLKKSGYTLIELDTEGRQIP